MNPKVVLNKSEQEVCHFIVKRRHEECIRTNAQHVRDWNPTLEEYLEANLHATGAENAAAKFLGVYWPASFHYSETGRGKYPDIGNNSQVRHTIPSHHSLIISLDGPDNQKHILVTGKMPEFYIMGWCWGWEGKKKEYLRNPPPRDSWAYFVPQKALHKFKFVEEAA